MRLASKRLRYGFVGLLWLLMSASSQIIGQTAPANVESTKQEPSAPELITLPVQVRDSTGKPVGGLKISDFRLQVDGKPQAVAVLKEMVRESGPSSKPSNSSGIGQGFSSTPAGGMPPQILIIAVDLVNTGFLGKGETQQQLLKYVIDGLPSEPFELVAITRDGLIQVHPFASAPTTDEQADDGDTKTEETKLSECESSKLEDLVLEPLNRSSFAWEIAARASLMALRQLADAYAGVPGRKTVLWLTAGVRAFGGDPTATVKQSGPVQMQVKSPLSTDSQLRLAYDEAFRALNTADMAVYPVDLKAMKGENIYLANYMAVYGNAALVGPFETNDGIKPLAAETGGRPCSAAANLKSCMETALGDADGYYLLGFYVAQAGRKSGWHKLELTAAPGSTVRTRSRYFLPSAPAPSQEAMRAYLMEAARSNTNYSGFNFWVERLPDAPLPANDPIRVRILVPASSIVLREGKETLSYEIAFVGVSSNGQPMRTVRVMPFNLTPEQTREAVQKGWRIEESWPKIDSMTSLRYVIRDIGTGRIGSVTVPLHKGTAAN